MSAFIPSTTVSVLRSVSAQNAWGDDVDTNTPIATGLPAAVVEDKQRSYLASEQRGGVVEYFAIRFRPGTDVREGDRLLDERSTAIYQVDTVSIPQSFVGIPDVRCMTRRTAATSSP